MHVANEWLAARVGFRHLARAHILGTPRTYGLLYTEFLSLKYEDVEYKSQKIFHFFLQVFIACMVVIVANILKNVWTDMLLNMLDTFHENHDFNAKILLNCLAISCCVKEMKGVFAVFFGI